MSSSHARRLQELALRGSSASETKTLLVRLLAEIRDRAAREGSAEYFVDIIRVLSQMKGSTHIDARLECLRQCFMALYAQGHILETLRCAKVLHEVANSGAAIQWHRIADLFAGIAYADAGDLPAAMLHYSDALECARRIRDLTGELATANNLGSALNYGGLYREAIPCFQHVVARADEGNEQHRAFKASAFCNLAQSHLSLGDASLAHEILQGALRGLPGPTNAYEALGMTIREFTNVQITIELSRKAECAQSAANCRLFAMQNGGPRARFLADIAEGLYEMRHGNQPDGFKLLRSSLDSSVAGVAIYRVTALKALVRAYDESNQPDFALECLRELLGLLKTMRNDSLRVLVERPASPFRLEHSPEVRDLYVLTCKEAELRTQVAERHLIQSQIETLERLAIAADLREESSGEHGFRVGALTFAICQELGFGNAETQSVEIAARLHDLGKISLPDRILLSPDTLAAAERQFVSAHTTIGSELLSNGSSKELRIAQQVALYHHEWWNGEGYPSRLAGKRIPIHARIVALADVFDALTHGRPFSPPWPIERALAEIRARRGTQFDPELTDVFLDLMDRLIGEHEDLDAYLGRASRHSPFLLAREKIHRMLAEERRQEETALAPGNATRH